MTKCQRVLFAIGSMEGGGAERQVVEILKHLDRSRFTPSLYLVNRRGELLDELPADVPVSAFSDVNWNPRLNYPGRFRRDLIAHITGVLREQRPSVAYDRCYPMTIMMAPATARAGVPRVSAAVADPAAEIGAHHWLGRSRHYREAKQAYSSADRVVVNSQGLKRRMMEYYDLPAELVTVIYNVLDVERIDRLAAQRGPAWSPDRFHIVCAGRLHPDKGYPYLLRAVDEVVHQRGLKQVQLHIFGQGPQEGELREFVAAQALGDHVCFEGFTVNPYSALQQADLFCLSSLNEGMPNALPEAMVCRLPALATDCHSGPREILEEGRLGRLVPTGNASALANAIEDAVNNYEAWRTPLEDARRHVIDTFSVKAGMSRLEEVLSAVGRSKR